MYLLSAVGFWLLISYISRYGIVIWSLLLVCSVTSVALRGNDPSLGINRLADYQGFFWRLVYILRENPL